MEGSPPPIQVINDRTGRGVTLWFRRGRLLIVSPDSQGTAVPAEIAPEPTEDLPLGKYEAYNCVYDQSCGIELRSSHRTAEPGARAATTARQEDAGSRDILKEAFEHATGSEKKRLRLPPSPPKDGSR